MTALSTKIGDGSTREELSNVAKATLLEDLSTVQLQKINKPAIGASKDRQGSRRQKQAAAEDVMKEKMFSVFSSNSLLSSTRSGAQLEKLRAKKRKILNQSSRKQQVESIE